MFRRHDFPGPKGAASSCARWVFAPVEFCLTVLRTLLPPLCGPPAAADQSPRRREEKRERRGKGDGGGEGIKRDKERENHYDVMSMCPCDYDRNDYFSVCVRSRAPVLLDGIPS